MAPRHARVPAVLFIAVTLLAWPLLAQAPQQKPDPLGEDNLMAVMHTISSHTLLDYVKEIASEKYQGRLTGTPGYEASADWVVKMLADWKVKPAGDQGIYRQHRESAHAGPSGELSLDIPISGGATIKKPYVWEKDYYQGSTSDAGTVTAEVIYVGYGATAPELGYDDYAGVDVKGKLVMMEPEVPVGPDRDAELFKKWRPYSFHDYKVRNAAKHGAAGMVYNYFIVNPNCVFIKGFLLSYVGPTVYNDVFAGTGKTHNDAVQSIRTTLKPASFATGKVMTIRNATEYHPEGVGDNIVGYLEGSDPELSKEAIIVGAHLDHLGMNDRLMPGAHDNASGVAVLLGAANALATSSIPLKRSVVFILFGAEEQGVRGSEYYVAHPFIPNNRVKAVLNLESVGRGERISAGAGKNYPQLWEVIDRLNRKYIHRPVSTGFNANLARPRQDAAHFMWADMPTIGFGTGGAKPLPYPTYHTTKDSPEIITPEIMEDLARLVFLSTVEFANSTTLK
jgi:hypothetical protein